MQITPDPRGATSEPASVWDGAEVLVVGGRVIDGQQVFTDEVRPTAVAYSPDTDTWRSIARPPTVRAINSLAAWTGREMLVIGGDNPNGSLLASGGIAYDPSADRWRTLASPPIGFVSARSPSAWTGTELLVWPSDGGGSSMRIAPMAYNPTTDTWRGIADGPAHPAAAPLWTDGRLIVFFKGAAMVYDESTDAWITEWDGGQAEFSGTALDTPSGVVIVGSWSADVGGAIYTPPT